jgi:type IV secretion system protein VirB2
MILERLKPYADLVEADASVMRLTRSAAAAAALALSCEPALAQSISPDPQGSGVIAGALNWLTGTLLGNVATGVAILAVAIIAILLMTGRMEWGRAALVVIGIFILFGAVSIVTGIRSLAGAAA